MIAVCRSARGSRCCGRSHGPGSWCVRRVRVRFRGGPSAGRHRDGRPASERGRSACGACGRRSGRRCRRRLRGRRR
ncbi:hypothetical protein C0R05_18550 [Streptomyces albidoflavus]|nr:hypothetical protein C0R05_18550 [Streptomyces albidoflavus]